jgi:predicted phosphodiesterase
MPEDRSQLHLYAIVSDIHGNYPALLAVEEDARRLAADEGFPPPTFICLGDTVDYGPQPNECVAWLARVQPKIVLQGNHDAEAVRPKRSRPRRVKDEYWATTIWTRYVLELQHRVALGAYPTSADGENSIGDFAFFHSDPWGGDNYMDSAKQTEPFFAHLPVHYCFAAFGHLHYQMLFVGDGSVRAVYAIPEGMPESYAHKRVNRWHVARDVSYLFNPGSVGQPRFHPAQPSRRMSGASVDLSSGEPDRRAAYMLLHKDQRNDLHYQWRRVDYDRQETIRQLRSLAWPKDILKDNPSPQLVLENDPPELDPLSEAELAQIMADLPNVVEMLAKMLE